ncbi:hypothetical protein [Paraburkholderia sp. BCC1876]|uniref:hypothetical protein n=1 Tax=Paraburkholderia sp. BCC1876 TaxID=2676303 RepID=UPI0015919BE4|nr:hypothetical protein [Paraburkholderia sp. BCC1876]
MADVSLIEEIQTYADGRKSDVARGAKTPALAALMVEKYDEGIAGTDLKLAQPVCWSTAKCTEAPENS